MRNTDPLYVLWILNRPAAGMDIPFYLFPWNNVKGKGKGREKDGSIKSLRSFAPNIYYSLASIILCKKQDAWLNLFLLSVLFFFSPKERKCNIDMKRCETNMVGDARLAQYTKWSRISVVLICCTFQLRLLATSLWWTQRAYWLRCALCRCGLLFHLFLYFLLANHFATIHCYPRILIGFFELR